MPTISTPGNPKVSFLATIPVFLILCYTVTMTPEQTNELESTLEEQQGGPIILDGQKIHMVVMSLDVYRDMVGIGSDEQLAASLAAIEEGIQDMQAGRTRPFREALDDLARKYEVQG